MCVCVQAIFREMFGEMFGVYASDPTDEDCVVAQEHYERYVNDNHVRNQQKRGKNFCRWLCTVFRPGKFLGCPH